MSFTLKFCLFLGTLGHCMVAIRTENGWLLNCGDACYPFYLSESEQYVSPPQKLIQLILGNYQPKIAALLKDHGDEIRDPDPRTIHLLPGRNIKSNILTNHFSLFTFSFSLPHVPCAG